MSNETGITQPIKALIESDISYNINGDQEYCIVNTMTICLHGVASEVLMISSKQYCGISNGSACNSNSYEPSYVLIVMGIEEEQIENSIRIFRSNGNLIPLETGCAFPLVRKSFPF